MGVNEAGHGLWQIGEFSRLTRISVRMMRYYQERGLLTPAWSDPFTGYRYFGSAELERAIRIRSMRDVGLPVEEIREALEADRERVVEILEYHMARLSRDAQETARQLAGALRLAEQIKDPTMSYEIARKTVPAQIRVALRKIIPDYSHESDLWAEFMPLIGAAGVAWDKNTVCGASYYDPDYKETDCDVEIWMTVPQAFVPAPPLQCLEVPPHEAISVTVTGPYDSTIGPASDALAQYADSHDLKPGAMYSIYLLGPGAGVSPDEYVTEVCSEIVAG